MLCLPQRGIGVLSPKRNHLFPDMQEVNGLKDTCWSQQDTFVLLTFKDIVNSVKSCLLAPHLFSVYCLIIDSNELCVICKPDDTFWHKYHVFSFFFYSLVMKLWVTICSFNTVAVDNQTYFLIYITIYFVL